MKVNLRDLVEVVGVAAIITSLVFVGLQMQQTQIIAATQNSIASYEVKSQALNEINSHAAIWTKANNGKPLTQEEQVVFGNLIGSLAGAHFFNWFQIHSLYGENSGLVEAYELAAFLHRNPGARAHWEKTEHQFLEDVAKHISPDQPGYEWVRLVEEHLGRLAEGA